MIKIKKIILCAIIIMIFIPISVVYGVYENGTIAYTNKDNVKVYYGYNTDYSDISLEGGTEVTIKRL